ncbi:MAG: hypothetical protein KF757_04120 [Phycisphaeraceae bacterium]|nr:hypothetical protein [Phycisphaeraceae bacterium]MCW5763188.1 hypothetical protein [Phycisphaeraceae bacterium]
MSSTKSSESVNRLSSGVFLKGDTSPLSPDEAAHLDRDLRRFREQFRSLLSEFPVEAQSASGLARCLGVERTTCQRLVSAVTGPYPGLSLVGQLPGVRGMQIMLKAAEQRDGFRTASLGEAHQAVENLDRTIRELAGSRSKLLRRVSPAEPSSARNVHDTTARERLFDAASEVTGRSSNLWLAAHVYTPTADPTRVAQSRVHGLIGHRARADAVPLTFHVFGDDPAAPEEVGRFRALRKPDAILREFSTSPLPIVRSRHPGEHVVQTIEENPDAPGSGTIDLVFGMTGLMSHPAQREHKLEEVWALVNFPVRRMLFDCFLHRDLARRCIPSLDHHLWRPDFSTQIGERWQTRFADGPRLELLPTGIEGARSEQYHRHQELLHTLFAAENLDPREYVGYRLDLEYPVWRTGYRMAFDFGEE